MICIKILFLAVFCASLEKRKRKGKVWEEGALKEETEEWVLLKKMGKIFGMHGKDHEENKWHQMVETDVVEEPVQKVARNKIVEATQKMKSGKATGPSEVSVEMIVASGEIGVKVIMELCQRVLDGKGMPDKWKTSVIVPISEGKGDVMSCGSYRGVKLPDHINLNKMPFGFKPGKGTVDEIFIVRRMQEKYQKKNKKLYMCFVDMEK